MRAWSPVYLGVFFALIIAEPGRGEQPNSYEAQKAEAYAQFHRGQVKQAVERLQALIKSAPSIHDKVHLQRDLLEMCTAAYDWRCVNDAFDALTSDLRRDRRLLHELFPDSALYGLKASLAAGDLAAAEQIRRHFAAVEQREGGPLPVDDQPWNPLTIAELKIALHAYHLRKNEFKAAEEAFSAAVLGLLASAPANAYSVCKVLIGLIDALIEAHDVHGALAIAAKAGPFISKALARDGVLYAEYVYMLGRLSSFTMLHSVTISTLSEASRLFEALQIEDGEKTHKIAVANSLMVAASLLDGKLEQAKEAYAKHPFHKRKTAILQRGEFHTSAEYFFAVVDLFVSVASAAPPDQRWKALFLKRQQWQDPAEMESYRHFALGLLHFFSDAETAISHLTLAARQRVDNFDAALRADFEGFRLPGLVDTIVIGAGLAVANKRGAGEDFELMLQGSELLGRNVRHLLSDVAALLAAQPDEGSRRDARAFVHLARQKRDWELDQIEKLLQGSLGPRHERGKVITRYNDIVTTLSDLKRRFQENSKFARARGLPSIEAVRQSMSERDALVVYFSSIGGVGKLCVRRNRAIHSFAALDSQAVSQHVRLLEFATTAAHLPHPELDSQFPVASAIYLRDFLFGGLEACLTPGTHVIVALPAEFASVPLGALLSEPPARVGDGYDLANARWLIRDFSFSLVVSARQYLAASAIGRGEPAPRPFLGVGDPVFGNGRIASAVFSNSLATPNGLSDFKELPETGEELRTVASLFAAGGDDMLLRKYATEQGFRTKPLSDYDVIHFATHGLIKEEIPGLTEAALLLTPHSADDKSDDGLLSASEISRLSLRARLVVLSACNTARYDMTQASLGVHDLQTAFTVAGVPTLLASLWPVESSTARDIVIAFFEKWRPGKAGGAAQSLAEAIRAFLQRSDMPRQHPRFWAPFVVVGNGGVTGLPATAPIAGQPTLSRH